jgi:hypothetical protein
VYLVEHSSISEPILAASSKKSGRRWEGNSMKMEVAGNNITDDRHTL